MAAGGVKETRRASFQASDQQSEKASLVVAGCAAASLLKVIRTNPRKEVLQGNMADTTRCAVPCRHVEDFQEPVRIPTMCQPQATCSKDYFKLLIFQRRAPAGPAPPNGLGPSLDCRTPSMPQADRKKKQPEEKKENDSC